MASDPTSTGSRRPQRFGKYEVIGHIASGGMGAVYRAVDVELKRPVALKVLNTDMAGKPAMLERFRREARSAAKLSHENIVTLYDWGEANGTHYLALEFVEGVDLHEYICRKGRLEPEEARQILIQAARALNHFHQAGIVHRDIKPSNFLVNQVKGRPRVKLTDLGLARETSADEFRVTKAGTTVGTVDYMSPEQGRDSGAADIRSDIYSLGCTFFHMLAGQAPFNEGSLTERLYQHAETKPPDVRTFNPNIPPALVAILARMLEKKPEDRYQTPAELLRHLEFPEKVRVSMDSKEMLSTLAGLASEAPPVRKAKPVPPAMRERIPSEEPTRQPRRPDEDEATPAPRRREVTEEQEPDSTPEKISRSRRTQDEADEDRGEPRPPEKPRPEPRSARPRAAAEAEDAEPRSEVTAKADKVSRKPRFRDDTDEEQEEQEQKPDKNRPRPGEVREARKPDSAEEQPRKRTFRAEDPDDEPETEARETRPRLSAYDDSGESQPDTSPEAAPRTEKVGRKRRFRDDEPEPEPAPTPEEKPATVSTGRRYRDVADDEPSNESGKGRGISLPSWWPLAAGGVVVAVIAGIIVHQLQSGEKGKPDKPPPVTQIKRPPVDNTTPDPVDPQPAPPLVGPPAPEYPLLYKPAKKPDRSALRKELFQGFGPFPMAQAKAYRFRVSRAATPGPMVFRSLAEALAQVPAVAGWETVIEIADPGPLFEASLPTLENRNVYLRGAEGYRPLLAWDVSASPPDPKKGQPAFLSLLKSRLVMENIDMVVKWNTEAGPEPACLFELDGSEFQARQCTFTSAGVHPSGVDLVRLEATGASRCRLSGCYARGADLTAFHAPRGGGDILVDHCLLVGTQRPMLDLSCTTDTTVRVLRSTFLSDKNFARLGPPPSPSIRRVRFSLVDSVLGRNPLEPGGELLRATTDAALYGAGWQAVNCLYDGWKTLLASDKRSLETQALGSWQKFWKYQEGDKAGSLTWLVPQSTRLEDTPARAFATENTAAGFAAVADAGTIGFDPDRVPAGPSRWLGRTFDPALLPGIDVPPVYLPPPIAPSSDGLYHGERVDLTRIDLGQLLESRLKAAKAAKQVALILTGQGDCLTSPIRVKGIEKLVIFFDTTKTPFNLGPSPRAAADKDALIDVADGSLDLVGARIFFPNSKFAPMPRRMIRVKNGNLRLGGCALQGPMRQGPPGFAGLIDCDARARGNPTTVALGDSILIADKTLLTIHGRSVRVGIKNSLLVSPHDVISLDAGPGPVESILCVLERNTLAFHRAMVHIREPAPTLRANAPIAILTSGNLFLAPFGPKPRQSSLLRTNPEAVAHGEITWQSKADGFDHKRLHAYLTPDSDDAQPSAAQPWSLWRRTWGPLGAQQPFLFDVPLTGKDAFIDNLNQLPPFERLRLPATIRPPAGQTLPGADLVRLGVLKRK
jgi:serine/threonine protein kinase